MTDNSQPASAPSAAAPTAPPQAAPPAAAPAQTDVPVQAPVDQPRPLGEQAPHKPEGQESNKQSHISRREALSKAFDRAKEAQEEAAKNPPKKAEAPKTPPKDAKAPEKPAERSERYREQGKFARDPAKAQDPGQQQSQRPGQEQQLRQVKPLDERAPYRVPPNRFSEQSKQEWNATPESVRGAVYQMAKEFQGAYQKYKGDNTVMNELRPYHDLATKQGTTLRKAFDNYYGMEAKLRQDLVGGLDIIIQNVARSQGLTGPTGAPLTLHDVAMHVASMTPEQRQLTTHRNQQTAAERQLAQMQERFDRQEQKLNQILYDQKFTNTRSQVDVFADTHPRFDELADLIKVELDHGYTLEVAYARADRLRPSTHAVQNRTQSAQTRKTSISGAPDGAGKTGRTRPSDGQRVNGEAKNHPTRREALQKAMRRVAGGV